MACWRSMARSGWKAVAVTPVVMPFSAAQAMAARKSLLQPARSVKPGSAAAAGFPARRQSMVTN